MGNVLRHKTQSTYLYVVLFYCTVFHMRVIDMNQKDIYRLGIDIGSTTVKIAILNEDGDLLFSDYERHFANIQETLADLLQRAAHELGSIHIAPVMTGSGGLALASNMEIPFLQEVVAVSGALKHYAPNTDVAIELGGEDAKIIYFENGNVEQRMNGVCAGGTGSFIDQMASLLQTDASGLNELAKQSQTIYPIAARCGVFAKSDIQPLINEGASREDLAASIFQAVVNQTISGLACGKPIHGHVAFLGGPLHFLSELRRAFVNTLSLTDETAILPEHSHLFAAIGSALRSKKEAIFSITELYQMLGKKIKLQFEVDRLPPLFSNETEYDEFRERHEQSQIPTSDLSSYSGRAYLGIDAGSTTTKVALVAEDGSLLYSFYSGNEGDPLATALKAIFEIYQLMPKTASIAYACSTGYGEALVKAALMLDEGEVETIAHYYAASFFDPQVDCIIDIGGQDMKCIKIKNQTVDSVQLNEACSSGCGSFIETFARSLNYSVEDFAREALFSTHPIDLGTRCTVFMNSKVKQAQKEGASVADISAGLAYSVIKNALYKVMKVSDATELGDHIVVQGGTFYNEAVLRSFELTADTAVIRPDISGIMGAFGAALIARERSEGTRTTTMLPTEELRSLTCDTTSATCKRCPNHCRLTVSRFSGNRKFITGNRCERGLGLEKKKSDIPNLYEYKMRRCFDLPSLDTEKAKRGRIGIPRVLNMYENYPLWHTMLTELGFSVVLSPASSRKIYEMGLDSIPSESQCYPAKLTHGHIQWLMKEGVTTIFYPCVPYEYKEFEGANNQYNCPIVTSYPENIKNNMDEIVHGDVTLLHSFVSLASEETILLGLADTFAKQFGITKAELSAAVKKGWQALADYRSDMRREGERVLAYLQESGTTGIVLAGRPYHVDPEIHHGIPDMICSYGVAVLTEDSVAHLGNVERPLNVMDQWTYHSRLYGAAFFVREQPNLELIQLNSFGCGLDAVTSDEVSDILGMRGKLYTILKIDEVNNLGAARIRVRSLLASIKIRDKQNEGHITRPKRISFTKEMKKEYTILCPQMSPLHFELLETAFHASGYRIEVLGNDNRQAVTTGLKYVNNDACYPSLIVVGQIMDAVLSGQYDTDKLAIVISQTGGGCRASNYIGFIRRALHRAGLGHIPVISVNLNGLESNPGFSLSPLLVLRSLYGVAFGDVFMRCIYRMRPYEQDPGATERVHIKWRDKCRKFLSGGYPSRRKFKQMIRDMIRDFDNIAIEEQRRPRVGIVGKILVKFMPTANNHLVELLEKEGAEAVVPDLMDFLLYCFYNQNFKVKVLGAKPVSALLGNAGIRLIEWLRAPARKAFEKSRHFDAPARIGHLAEMARQFVSTGNQTGEGWFLTGEMLELIQTGTTNIVCTQPFGCLPNHIVGKGVIKELRRVYPASNIVAIDFDPGASEVNQLNRIKLMLSNTGM